MNKRCDELLKQLRSFKRDPNNTINEECLASLTNEAADVIEEGKAEIDRLQKLRLAGLRRFDSY